MTAYRLDCPKCRRNVPEAYRREEVDTTCPLCRTEFEFHVFPAMTASRAALRARAVEPGEATCFFHETNRAESVCEACGRFVCAVCSVDFANRKLCPGCLEQRGRKQHVPENHRVLYDSSAVALAILPLLMWPLTFLTAPATLGFVVYGWRQPNSLLGVSRAKFIIAALVALLQMAAWAFLIITVWLE